MKKKLTKLTPAMTAALDFVCRTGRVVVESGVPAYDRTTNAHYQLSTLRALERRDLVTRKSTHRNVSGQQVGRHWRKGYLESIHVFTPSASTCTKRSVS